MSQLNILDNVAISFITFDGLQIHFPSWISVTHFDDCFRIDLRNVSMCYFICQALLSLQLHFFLHSQKHA